MADIKSTVIPVPAKMNTDLSPSLLAPDEAPDIYNYLIHEPGQLRSRKGPTFKAAFPGTSYVYSAPTPDMLGYLPVGVAVTSNNKIVATAQSVTGNLTRAIVSYMAVKYTDTVQSTMYHRQTPGGAGTAAVIASR